jgi:6-phosphogluconolactonase
MSERTIRVFPTPAEVARQAAIFFTESAADAIALTGRFTVGLSGGRTPKALYELLATDGFADQVDWANVEIFFGDERTVPPDHPDSNFRMASESLLDHVPLPKTNVHRMRGELDPEAAAIEYGKMLKDRFSDDGGLDLALLGMGDDGHTASLFPGTEALKEPKHRCVANFVPKLNTWRITMSAPFLSRSREVLVLVEGASKAARIQEVLEGPPEPDRLPIQMIQPQKRLVWLMDVAAAGM